MFKVLRNILIYAVGLILIGLAIGQFTGLIKTLNQRSLVIGTFDYEKTETVEVAGYDFGLVVPFKKSVSVYRHSVEFDAVNFDAQRNDYRVLINGKPTELLRHQGGLIEAQTAIRFYALDGSLAGTFELKARFEFMSAKTTLILESPASAAELKLMNQYIENEGLIVQVVYDQQITIKEVIT